MYCKKFSKDGNFAPSCPTWPAPLHFALHRFSTPRKSGGVGMGQDFSPTPQEGTGMGLDFLDPPRPAPFHPHLATFC